jgi:hypothetical protein
VQHGAPVFCSNITNAPGWVVEQVENASACGCCLGCHLTSTNKVRSFRLTVLPKRVSVALSASGERFTHILEQTGLKAHAEKLQIQRMHRVGVNGMRI